MQRPLRFILLLGLQKSDLWAQQESIHASSGTTTRIEGGAEPDNRYLSRPKEFDAFDDLPKTIQDVARTSLRKLCVCEITLGTCYTVFAYREGFLTCAHALEVLEQAAQTYEKDTGKKCENKFLILEPDSKASPVNVVLEKRGAWPKRPGMFMMTTWKPENHFAIPLDQIADHRSDLAYLKVTGLRVPAVPLVGGEAQFKKGQKVYHLGFSNGPGLSDQFKASGNPFPQVSSGEIRDIKSKNIEADFLGVPGTSGGPVLSEGGKLLGVFWGKQQTYRESLLSLKPNAFVEQHGYPRERSYFIPIDAVDSFLSTLPPTTSSGGKAP